MSTYNANMTLVNATKQQLNGTITHMSGDGSNAPQQPFTISGQPQFTCSGSNQIVARTDHDDFWLWTPSVGNPTRLKKNLDQSLGACVVVTDNELVVVTSDNGVASTGLAGASAAAV